MKRKMILPIALILVLVAFFSTAALPQKSLPLGDTQITFEKAMEIASARVGGGIIKEIEWERKSDGRFLYEIEIYHDGMKYEIKSDAVTGEIINVKKESKRFIFAPPNGLPPAQVTSARSVEFAEIARAQTGGGIIREIKWEIEKEQLICEIEITNGERDFEFKFDAATGEIIKSKSKLNQNR